MADVQIECPSCGATTTLGDVICPSCGVNLKSGEAFDTRVQKAKGKATHPEHFSGRIYGSVVVAFVLCAFGMYMYHRAVIGSMREVPDYYKYPVQLMLKADDFVAMGHTAQAGGNMQQAREHYETAGKGLTDLIAWLQAEADKLDPEKVTKRRYNFRTEKKFNKGLVRRQLNNIRLKAEYKLSLVPS